MMIIDTDYKSYSYKSSFRKEVCFLPELPTWECVDIYDCIAMCLILDDDIDAEQVQTELCLDVVDQLGEAIIIRRNQCIL